jgi:PAS domain S-box-containing protein
MFRVEPQDIYKTNRLAIAGILALSTAALGVTIWIMGEFLREQVIVQSLIKRLPIDARASAEHLAGELRWQFRLTTLVVLNLVVTAFALILLWRAYQSSQESLRDFKALAADILSSMDQGVITTDLSGTITSINERCLRLLGIEEDAVGKPLSELNVSVPLDQLRHQSHSADTGLQPSEHTFVVRGVSRTLSTDCQPLRDHDKAKIGHIIQLWDVSERVLMDERMRRMERYMGLGSLAAGLHHEIKIRWPLCLYTYSFWKKSSNDLTLR